MTEDLLNVSPTRSELLDVKNRAVLARKGHSLLKKKQDVLINEFFERIKEYHKHKRTIQHKTAETYRALSLDIAYSGIAVSRSVSYAMKEAFSVEHESKNIMGLKLPEIRVVKKEDFTRNIFENAPQLIQAERMFRDLFQDVVRLASMELTIYALAEEIKKIKRRTNSLEYIQIPRIDRTRDYIRFVLDEQERESFTRLKMIKQRLEAQ